jgi:Transposase IS66 family
VSRRDRKARRRGRLFHRHLFLTGLSQCRGHGAPGYGEDGGDDQCSENEQCGRKPRRVGHNLLLRLDGRKHDVLRFLSDPTVPFTNTVAERDARMMKTRQKISGGFRSEAGAVEFGVIRSVLSTARKQRWNILRTLTANPSSLIADLRVA